MRSRRWLPVVVAAVILAASLVPGGGGSSSLGPIGVDKLLHVGGYAVLAVAALVAIHARTGRGALGVVLLVTVFGGVVELLQGPVPGRSVSFLDLVADAAGAVIGAAGWWLFGSRADGSAGASSDP